MELKNPDQLVEAQAMAKALREKKVTNHVAEAQKIVNRVLARRREKEAERQKFWDEYNDQLEKGNSNIGSGARHSLHRGIRVRKVC